MRGGTLVVWPQASKKQESEQEPISIHIIKRAYSPPLLLSNHPPSPPLCFDYTFRIPHTQLHLLSHVHPKNQPVTHTFVPCKDYSAPSPAAAPHQTRVGIIFVKHHLVFVYNLMLTLTCCCGESYQHTHMRTHTQTHDK